MKLDKKILLNLKMHNMKCLKMVIFTSNDSKGHGSEAVRVSGLDVGLAGQQKFEDANLAFGRGHRYGTLSTPEIKRYE